MEYELIALGIGIVSGMLGTWIKMTNEVTKIKSRLFSLEKSETKVEQTLDILVEGMNEIKLLLAERGIRKK
jgi:mannose/fructose/N-acetylgalactosamine-specific phosphotransferase system component IID